MFGPDFYPTPQSVAKTMLKKISDDAVHFLEPSAGKDDLAVATGQSPTSGGYFNNLGRLRSLGLIDYPRPGFVVAKSVLFLEA